MNGAASRGEQRMVQARASAAGGEDEPTETPTEEAYIGSDGLAVAPASAPDEVKSIIEAGNAIATKPYKYGGGHARWNDSGYDCSGSVSYVLHAAGLLNRALDSSGFMSWGEAGRGAWMTICSNPGHAYMIVAGLRFDTSARRQTGTRWSEQMRSAVATAGVTPKGYETWLRRGPSPRLANDGGTMAVAVLLLLLLSAFAGLAAGRRRAVIPPAAAVIPCTVVGGVATGGLALLATAGLAAGVHLHRVVRAESDPSVGLTPAVQLALDLALELACLVASCRRCRSWRRPPRRPTRSADPASRGRRGCP